MRTLLVIIALLLINCGSNKKIEKIVIPKDYKSWRKPVKKILDYEIPGHGKSFRVIYANDASYKAKITKSAGGDKQIVFPDGSIIVKEVYKKREDIDKKKPVLTIMIKDAKSGSSLKGWIYIVKKPGKDLKIIMGRMCVGCHESANEKHPYFDKNKNGIFRDYLFVPIVK